MINVKRWVSLILFISVLLLAGCAGEVPDITLQTTPTVSDIFHQPTTEPTLDGTEATEPTSGRTPAVGEINHGFRASGLKNDRGRYDVYEGGELHLQYSMLASGAISEHTFGLVLILDGQPQPYKTTEDGECAYIHTFEPEDGKRIYIDLYFVPVTGQKGDTLELSAFYVIEADYYPRGSHTGFMQTAGSGIGDTQLVFEETPPQVDMPQTTERILTQTVEYVDLTSAEAQKVDIKKACFFDYTAAGQQPIQRPYVFGIDADQPLKIHAEVYGAVAPQWGLIFYVNHQPVSVLPENLLQFRMQEGQKMVVDMELDVSDFDGEAIVYAVLYLRNWRDSEVMEDITCRTSISKTYYLTDAADWDAVCEKYK